MKNKLFLSLFLLVLLVSCTTTVSLNTLRPSEVDLGANQVIAVAKTDCKVSNRFRYSIPVYVEKGIPVPEQVRDLTSYASFLTTSKIENQASKTIYNALSEGVYRIVDSETTQKLIKSASVMRSASNVLRANGVTLLLESSIDALNYDEYVTGRAMKSLDGQTYYNYYLVQRASLSLSCKLTDLKTGRTVDATVFSGKYPKYDYEEETLIGTLDVKGKYVDYSYNGNFAGDLFTKVLDSFKNGIRNRLVPHNEVLSFGLMTSKENKEYSEINKLVSEGYTSIAYDKYSDIYNKTNDVVAGYNCAVLMYALGNQAEAIDFAQKLYRTTLNADVGKLVQKMEGVYADQQTALKQVGAK